MKISKKLIKYPFGKYVYQLVSLEKILPNFALFRVTKICCFYSLNFILYL